MAITSNPAFEQALYTKQNQAWGSGLLPTSYFYRDTGKPMLREDRPVYGNNGELIWPGTGAGATGAGASSDSSASTSNPNVANPYTTLRNVKNPEVDKRLTELYGQYDTTKAANAKTLDDYIKEHAEQIAKNKTQLGVEQSAISDVYDPQGLQRRLDQELEKYRQATLNVGNLASNYANSANSAGAMAGGSTGASKYRDLLAMQNYRDIFVPLERDIANRRLARESDLTNLRLGTAGKSALLGNQYLQSLLTPADIRSTMLNRNSQGLAGLSATDLANTFYGLYTPNNQTYYAGARNNYGNLGGGYDPYTELLNYLRNQGGQTTPQPAAARPQQPTYQQPYIPPRYYNSNPYGDGNVTYPQAPLPNVGDWDTWNMPNVTASPSAPPPAEMTPAPTSGGFDPLSMPPGINWSFDAPYNPYEYNYGANIWQ